MIVVYIPALRRPPLKLTSNRSSFFFSPNSILFSSHPAVTMALPLFLFLGFALLLMGLFKVRNIGTRPKNLPPGPPTKWLLGNLLQMPREKAYLQFKKWADEYGPIYTLILGTQTTIVLTDAEIVKDLLDKRSGIYSSRPEAYLSRVASKGLRMAGMVGFFSSFFLSPPHCLARE